MFDDATTDPILQMEWHAEQLRNLLENFDLSVHNDERNEHAIEQAKSGLAWVETGVGDLIP